MSCAHRSGVARCGEAPILGVPSLASNKSSVAEAFHSLFAAPNDGMVIPREPDGEPRIQSVRTTTSASCRPPREPSSPGTRGRSCASKLTGSLCRRTLLISITKFEPQDFPMVYYQVKFCIIATQLPAVDDKVVKYGRKRK